MRSVLAVARVTLTQQCLRKRNWTLLILLLVAFGYEFAHGEASHLVYQNPAVVAILMAIPLSAAAGIVWDETATGRAMIFHSHGVSRQAFVLGRVLGAIAACWFIVAIPEAVLLGWQLASHSAQLLTALYVLTGAAIYFAYTAALLALFSTFMRSWNNSAFVVVLQLSFFLMVIPLLARYGNPSGQVFRYARLISLGPIHSMLQSASSQPPMTVDIALSLTLAAVCSSGAILIYARRELGIYIARDDA